MTVLRRIVMTIARTPSFAFGVLMAPVYTLVVTSWTAFQIVMTIVSYPQFVFHALVRGDPQIAGGHFREQLFDRIDSFALQWAQLWHEEKSLVKWWLGSAPPSPPETEVN
jgi:hypothetical protein